MLYNVCRLELNLELPTNPTGTTTSAEQVHVLYILHTVLYYVHVYMHTMIMTYTSSCTSSKPDQSMKIAQLYVHVHVDIRAYIINPRRACAEGLRYLPCVCVCVCICLCVCLSVCVSVCLLPLQCQHRSFLRSE